MALNGEKRGAERAGHSHICSAALSLYSHMWSAAGVYIHVHVNVVSRESAISSYIMGRAAAAVVHTYTAYHL